jgi:hypothetical protein
MRLTALFAALLIPASAFPDDKKPEPKKAEVKGSLRLNGQGVDGGTVAFHPADGGKPFTTRTDANGNFKLELPAGDYNMAFEKLIETKMKDSPTRNIFEPRYSDPKTSGIKATVKDGANEFIFETKSK